MCSILFFPPYSRGEFLPNSASDLWLKRPRARCSLWLLLSRDKANTLWEDIECTLWLRADLCKFLLHLLMCKSHKGTGSGLIQWALHSKSTKKSCRPLLVDLFYLSVVKKINKNICPFAGKHAQFSKYIKTLQTMCTCYLTLVWWTWYVPDIAPQ